jgi:hypothetical protein
MTDIIARPLTASENCAIEGLEILLLIRDAKPILVAGEFYLDDDALDPDSETDFVSLHPVIDVYATDDGRYVVVSPETVHDVTALVREALARDEG